MKMYDSDIEILKNNVLNLTIIFNNLSSKSAKENRLLEKNKIENKNQNIKDINDIIELRNNALKIFDKCNDILQK